MKERVREMRRERERDRERERSRGRGREKEIGKSWRKVNETSKRHFSRQDKRWNNVKCIRTQSFI